MRHALAPIDKLYSHQVTTFEASALRKENVFVTTSFASGKSLAYTLPLLHAFDEAIRENKPKPKVFLLFPTKALAQDQCAKLKKYEPEFWKVCTIDGDTPFQERNKMLESCDLFLTNPDTLHAYILKDFRRNKQIQFVLRNLRFIVLDEVHVYTGRFGAHVSCVMKRLRRALRKVHDMPLAGAKKPKAKV